MSGTGEIRVYDASVVSVNVIFFDNKKEKKKINRKCNVIRNKIVIPL